MFSFTFDNVLAPGRYNPVIELAHRGSGLDVMDRFESGFSFVVTGAGGIRRPGRPARRLGHGARRRRIDGDVAECGMSVEAADEQSSAPARLRRARAADQGSAGADRRLAAVLASDLQHRHDAVEAALLRLGARVRLAGDPAADAVRRAVRVLHEDRQDRRGPAARPRQHYGAQLLGAIVLFTFFQEATLGAVRCVVDNEALVRKIQFPRMVIPLSIGAPGDVQPRAEPHRRTRLRARSAACGRCSTLAGGVR